MSLSVEEKKQVLENFSRKTGDTGSSESQIALLTYRIKSLTEHFKSHKKDYSSRRGLLNLVSQRKKLLTYLKNKNTESYKGLIKKLGLRS